MVEDVRKASPDDPVRPGWPAGTEGGVGGKFRPKGGGGSGSADERKARLRRLVARRAFRAGLRTLLKPGRLLRLGVETASNAVPVLDVVGDAAMMADLAQLRGEIASVTREMEVAQAFAERGPRDLSDLLVSAEEESFSSLAAFKKGDLEKRFGPAGEGYEYHHIVEQGPNGASIAPELLQSIRNIVKIPKLLHEEVSSEFSRVIHQNGGSSSSVRMSLRGSLGGRSFDDQYQAGLGVLRKVGLLK